MHGMAHPQGLHARSKKGREVDKSVCTGHTWCRTPPVAQPRETGDCGHLPPPPVSRPAPSCTRCAPTDRCCRVCCLLVIGSRAHHIPLLHLQDAGIRGLRLCGTCALHVRRVHGIHFKFKVVGERHRALSSPATHLLSSPHLPVRQGQQGIWAGAATAPSHQGSQLLGGLAGAIPAGCGVAGGERQRQCPQAQGRRGGGCRLYV